MLGKLFIPSLDMGLSAHLLKPPYTQQSSASISMYLRSDQNQVNHFWQDDDPHTCTNLIAIPTIVCDYRCVYGAFKLSF